MRPRLTVSLLITSVLVLTSSALAQFPDGSTGPAPGGTNPELAAGHRALYLVTYAVSSTVDDTATVISVTNTRTLACPVSIDWFPGSLSFPSATSLLTLSGGTPTGQTADFCSRSVPSVFCNANANIPILEGRAIVGTTTACLTRLAVNARVYHISSGAVIAVTSVNVVKLPAGSQGD